ncbi:hypothetical protein [Prochlorococcus marinus]|nr:hypothetical protein [Prochlorococcus marinus]
MSIKLKAIGLLLTPLVIGLVAVKIVKAGVDPAIHKLCSDVKDYSGCVESQSRSIKKTLQNDDVLNKCKQGYAYVGDGNCQQVTCVNAQGWGMANQDEPLIAGTSNWKCKSKLVIGWMNSGRGQLRLGAVARQFMTLFALPESQK